MKVYAIFVNGQWYLAQLVLASEYGVEDDDEYSEPVWSELRTTAYICKHKEPARIIRLKEDM